VAPVHTIIQVENADLEVWEHRIEAEIESDSQLLETEREALIVARGGQGLFKQRVMQIEDRGWRCDRGPNDITLVTCSL
jgi:hypothetical protein